MQIVKDPVYYQLTQKLKEKIITGKYPPGEKFQTEREIAEEYGVSRATANKALAGLVSEGLLNFRKGVGTFVQASPLDNDLTSLVSFTARAKDSGLPPSTKLIAFKKIERSKLPRPLAGLRRLPDDIYPVYMERLRFASDLPVILEYRYLFSPDKDKPAKKDLEGSLYVLLEEKFSIKIIHVEQQIRAVILTKREAELLGTPEGSPAIELRALACTEGMTPLWQERTLYRSDVYAFSNIIDFAKGHQTGGFQTIRDTDDD